MPMARPAIPAGPAAAPAAIADTLLQRIALVAVAAPKRIIVAAVLVMVVCGIFGLPVTKMLSIGGFTDPASESVRAADILAHKFNQSAMQLMITVTAAGGVQSAGAAGGTAAGLGGFEGAPQGIRGVPPYDAPPRGGPGA